MPFTEMNKRWIFLALVMWVSGFAGCTPEGDTSREIRGADHFFTLRIDDQAVQAQIAISPNEQRQGLMGRESMGAAEGMLFPYKRPQQMGFWMANTLIHLDIGFFDSDGVLREIFPMYAGDTQSTVSRRDNLQFALEMNHGWFAANKIRPGAQMNLDDLKAALKSRGENLQDYEL